MRVHVGKDFQTGFGKLEVLSRWPIERGLRVTGYDTIDLQTSEDRIYVALSQGQHLRLLEGLCHLIPVPPAVLKQV